MFLHTSPHDFFRAGLIHHPESGPWTFEALSHQVFPGPGDPAPKPSVFRSRGELEAFLREMEVDALIVPQGGARVLTPMSAKEIVDLLAARDLSRRCRSFSVGSTEVPVIEGLHRARAWFKARRRPS